MCTKKILQIVVSSLFFVVMAKPAISQEMETGQNNQAEDNQEQSHTILIPPRETLVMIEEDDLPAVVQSAVSEGYFNDWEILRVFRVPHETTFAEPAYLLDVEKDGVVMILHYNESGRLLFQQRGGLDF